MSIRTLIVDDERLARQRLRRMLAAHEQIEIVGECADGDAAIACAEKEEPDLLLLDIQMPGIDGFGVVEALGACPYPIVIFVTAFDEHAIRAFEACALDYLLKPVSPARLEKALARAEQHLAALKASAARAEDRAPAAQRYHVRSGQRTSFIAPEEIDWVEAGGNYAILHVGAQNHLLRATMSTLEQELPENFVRTSRSAIVNLRRVKELQSSGGNYFAVMQDDARVSVTGSIRELQQRLRALKP